MPDEGEYFAPVQYQTGWIWLGVAVVVLVVLWYVFVLLFTRTRRERPVAPPAPVDRRSLAERYVSLVGEIEREHAEGRISSRAAHQRLGTLVRLFAHEASGVPAQVMTLDDLAKAELHPVAETVAAYYPAEFAELEQGDVATAAELARRMVTTWR